jgi:hypothetical protein
MPLTGASRMCSPREEVELRTAFATSGTDVDISIHVPPSAIPSSTPPGPDTASATCRGVGNIVITRSLFAATSAAVVAHIAPPSISSSADSGRRSLTTSG